MNEKFFLKVCASRVRALCIAKRYYTLGDCVSYERMLEPFFQLYQEATPYLLRKTARDIKEHSITKDSEETIFYNLMDLIEVVTVSFDFV